MEPITRKEYYIAKAAGLYSGKTPNPVLAEDYYLAKLCGDYSGECPKPFKRYHYFLAKAAEVYSGDLPDPITREEIYWAAFLGIISTVPTPVTREEQLIFSLLRSIPDIIEKTASGSPITISSASAPFTQLLVFGRSTQDGTPSPSSPVPIETAGSNGQIGVSVTDGGTQSQSLILSTPNGLPGVPVNASATEYTYQDASGQKWIADSVEMFADGTGQYVQRCGKINAKNLTWNTNFDFAYHVEGTLVINSVEIFSANVNSGFCNVFRLKEINPQNQEVNIFSIAKRVIARLSLQEFSNIQDWKNYIDSNDVVFLYPLATPITTPLSAEEVAAFKALTTYEPTTVVQNDAGCWMTVGYRAKSENYRRVMSARTVLPAKDS